MKRLALFLFLLPVTGFAGSSSQLIQATSPLSISNGTISLTAGNLTGTAPLSVNGGTGSVIGSGVSLGVNTANLLGSGPISVTGGTGVIVGSSNATLACATANGSTAGCLTSTDWNTFNGKQAAGNYITALTGDVTASGPGSTASTVAKIAGVSVGTPTGTGNVVMSASPTLTGTATIASATISGSLKDGNYHIEPGENNAGNSSTAQTIDWSAGSSQLSTLTGNVTYTFSNGVAGGAYVLRIATGSGGFTATWPGSVKWSGGTAPTITTTASKVDLINFYYDGTTWYGSFAQNF